LAFEMEPNRSTKRHSLTTQMRGQVDNSARAAHLVHLTIGYEIWIFQFQVHSTLNHVTK
jgi:hypothetical protein